LIRKRAKTHDSVTSLASLARVAGRAEALEAKLARGVVLARAANARILHTANVSVLAECAVVARRTCAHTVAVLVLTFAAVFARARVAWVVCLCGGRCDHNDWRLAESAGKAWRTLA
jgi:hypothetical protein